MPAMSKVLIVEDQAAVARALSVLFEVNDVPCRAAASPEQALEMIDREEFGVVIQDMNFTPGATSGGEGLELFRRIRSLDPELPVLVITAWSSLAAAVQMVKEGASDYLAKPWDDAKLLSTVRTLMRLRELQLENERLRTDRARARADLAVQYDLRDVLYESAAMHRVVSLAVQVAASDVAVLVTGPNGAGKEKIAEIVQANSRRRAGPFVKVNAGALPDELLESELFGAEAGAYTGSLRRRVGRFEAADGGTLFLDEIGNLSPAGQAKLLRVVQCGEFERLGSSETRKVDVRVLAATNVDLREGIARGRFREDLFYRLNVIELAVPALRDRPEDVTLLAEHFLLTFVAASGGRALGFSRSAREALLEHPWPGNVRELMNRIQRATLIASESTLTAEDLGFGSDAPIPVRRSEAASPADPRDEGERRRLEEALRESEGMVSRAASRLGLSRQALYRRMEKLGIVLERRPKA
jgi:DNA-binding NtrC family response regulator